MSFQSGRHAIVLLFVCYITAVRSFQTQPWSFPERITRTVLQERKRTKQASSGGFGNAVKDLMSSTFPYTGPLRPGKQSPQRVVLDESIVKPDYWQTGVPKKGTPRLLPWMIEVKTPEEIVKMRAAGKLARQVLDLAGRSVRPGITTDEIDTIVYNEIVQVRVQMLVPCL